MSFYKKLRDNNSMIQLTAMYPRVSALFNSHLNKYIVTMKTDISSNHLRKRLGFNKTAFFNIIVDVKEEVFLNVFNQKIIKVWVCCDSCELINIGNDFSMFWRNQKERSRELRIFMENGDQLRLTRHGHFIKKANNKNKEEGV